MLDKRPLPTLVPNYSLTGDLLSFMRCGLQYRYQNGSALPPSRPVQQWFGEFIHGVMETAYRLWRASQPPFPWPSNPTQWRQNPPAGRALHDIGSIGDLVEISLQAAGKSARSGQARDSAYERATLAVNEIGPELFPLITAAEERVIGTRPLALPAGMASRAQMYELHGIMDVLSSVAVQSGQNAICEAVRAVVPSIPPNAEIIVDYKGSDRPGTTDPYWAQGEWQLQMYAWLRSKQPNAAPVVAGVLLYVNELQLADSGVKKLRTHVSAGTTDVKPVPNSPDDYQLRNWQSGTTPAFSTSFRKARMIRVVPITTASMTNACAQFDRVVLEIEKCVGQEAQHGAIVSHWPCTGDAETCSACDFRHFCPKPHGKGTGYVPGAPHAP
jgi:hypothetical protein